MRKCLRCASLHPDTTRFCGNCGASLDARSPASLIPTEVSGPRRTESDPSEEGRFLPGTLLGDRYRIVSLVGAGGMGEVYRATDLRLSQPVALKFLPEATARDPKALARFHNEVRIARQVAHPNVCRVYDIGEVEGCTYLSMEYVDGEDLNSLLRRIGRLPPDKAVEIARKLCAGLAAAHDKGVLHRDLKPANVMIDGRGQVLITDFGLAGVMGEIEGSEARNGTPAYMAPEQLSGKAVSAQSDIYGLGVVLYELFTGRRPYQASTRAELARLAAEGQPSAPRTLVRDIDPAVESVILRCLEPDPRERPRSAMAVLAALPGGDPLAAALASGETPSPELVAAAGDKAGMKPRVALIWLAAVVAGLAVLAALNQRVDLFARIPFDQSPEILSGKARDVLAQLGYTERPDAVAYGFDYRVPTARYLVRELPGPSGPRLAKGRPATVVFWYRSSPAPLAPHNPGGVIRVSQDDPPADVPGMRTLLLDPQGRLLRLKAVPAVLGETPGSGSEAAVWRALFQTAGLDPAQFQPAAPEWTPPVASDPRAAWTGSYPEAPEIPIRVEAAALGGKPVYFDQFGPWSKPPTAVEASGDQKPAGDVVYIVLQLIVILGSIPVVRYNVRLGRGDTRGALRIGLFATFVGLASWLIGGAHVSSINEADLFFTATMNALFAGVTVAITYLSFEPFVRRKWPQTIISWSRLLTCGGVRDPLFGKDLLIGTTMGLALSLIQGIGSLTYLFLGISTVRLQIRPYVLMGGRSMVGDALFLINDSLYKGLGILFLMFIVRSLLRKQWLAAGVLTIALAGVLAPNNPTPLISWPVNIVFFGAMVFTLMRFGLVAGLMALFITSFAGSFPLGTDFSVWYAGQIVFTMVVVLAIAIFGFRTALAGQRVFAEP